jgi:hypothetical protein
VKAVSAHVHKEQIVLDDPVDLSERTAVEVLLPDHADFAAALEKSAAEFERGEIENARAFALRLVARS